jgi:hypothetical protein
MRVDGQSLYQCDSLDLLCSHVNICCIESASSFLCILLKTVVVHVQVCLQLIHSNLLERICLCCHVTARKRSPVMMYIISTRFTCSLHSEIVYCVF